MLHDKNQRDMLEIKKKNATYAYDWKSDFNAVEFLEVKFRSSD